MGSLVLPSGISYRLYIGAVPEGFLTTGSGSTLDFGLLTPVGTYTVVATNIATGCTSNMVGSATVAIDPTVIPSLSIATGIGDTCLRRQLRSLFLLLRSMGARSAVYAWTVNGIAVPVSGPAYTYLPANGDHVTVVFTSSIPCAVPPSLSSALTLSVWAVGAPSVSISGSPADTICEGTLTNFMSVATYGGPAPALTWVVDGAIVVSGTAYAYHPADHDDIYCILGSNYYCRTADSGFSNHIIMSVADSATPVVSITATPSVTISPRSERQSFSTCC